ncbi:hypothetical protein [Streptomyces sp. NPDC001404]|uniref:hypothetical protein n=1 Tax=Streptomyces sp. NPDC001404 TaxID=3364571 RepID=UPI0036812D9D
MPTPTPCPGTHNNAWRAAEAERQATGIDHDLKPVWGQPVHCPRCADRARSQLADLPELLAAIWLEALHGTRPKTTGTIGRSTTPSWPGQAARMITDHIIGGLIDFEDDIRDLRGLRPRVHHGQEGTNADRAITFLTAHLSWALECHPMAGEPHDRLSANPAAQIHHWHAAAQRFTRRDIRMDRYGMPCPRCELLSLYRTDGDDYIECRNLECGQLLTPGEYEEHCRAFAKERVHQTAA